MEQHEFMDQMDIMFQMSDMTDDEYAFVKEAYISRGQTNNALQAMLSRSMCPEYRNMVRSAGELYAPVCYSPDYIVKLVKKPSWGGWILTITLWDMMVIDVDGFPGSDEDELPHIISNITYRYPNDLFYINKTNRGYHLYLVSRRISHATPEAVKMRIYLNGDPAHGTNSLYSGASVRISRKNTDPTGDNAESLPLPSVFLQSCGNGQADPELLALYDKVQSYIATYGRYQIGPNFEGVIDLMVKLQQEWDYMPDDHGSTHIKATSPYLLTDGKPVPTEPFTIDPNSELALICNSMFKRTIKYKNIHSCYGVVETLVPILLWSHYTICFNNLYRILESTEDYAYVVHTQENCYAISYRDLFVVDYDCPQRIQILHRYVRNNPWCTFRLVRTTKGYHAFLTSRPIHHRLGIELLHLLRSDPLHMLSSFHRGYGVRVNQKSIDERPYRETQVMGTAPEDPRLVALYQLHLQYYERNRGTCPIYMVAQTSTNKERPNF